MRYAVLETQMAEPDGAGGVTAGGVVVNVVEAEADFAEQQPGWLLVEGLEPEPTYGWQYKKGKWSPPADDYEIPVPTSSPSASPDIAAALPDLADRISEAKTTAALREAILDWVAGLTA